MGSEAGAVKGDTLSICVECKQARLTVNAQAAAVHPLVAGRARALVLALDVDALLVAHFPVVQHVVDAFLLHHALGGVDDVLAGWAEALRAVRRHLAVVVALEVLARRAVGAGELVVGTIDVSITEL